MQGCWHCYPALVAEEVPLFFMREISHLPHDCMAGAEQAHLKHAVSSASSHYLAHLATDCSFVGDGAVCTARQQPSSLLLLLLLLQQCSAGTGNC